MVKDMSCAVVPISMYKEVLVLISFSCEFMGSWICLFGFFLVLFVIIRWYIII
jgi:hypothetical protein